MERNVRLHLTPSSSSSLSIRSNFSVASLFPAKEEGNEGYEKQSSNARGVIKIDYNLSQGFLNLCSPRPPLSRITFCFCGTRPNPRHFIYCSYLNKSEKLENHSLRTSDLSRSRILFRNSSRSSRERVSFINACSFNIVDMVYSSTNNDCTFVICYFLKGSFEQKKTLAVAEVCDGVERRRRRPIDREILRSSLDRLGISSRTRKPDRELRRLL